MLSSISRRAGRSPCARSGPTDAFITLVMLDDGYIPGALVLGYALRRQNPEFLLICMITEEISSQGRELLGVIFDHVIEVEKIHVPCKPVKQSHYLSFVFTKLNALLLCSGGLLSFDPGKIILLDADVLPLRNFHELLLLSPPAGIINEYKSNLVLTDDKNRFVVKASTRLKGTWHWHNIYNAVCPHGRAIPKYITDRVRDNPENMGVHGGLLILKPDIDQYDRIRRDVCRPGVRAEIRRYRWPEMQYLTIRWSGLWTNIDIKYCGFKGYPSLDLLYGTHFAGVKPWRLGESRPDLYRLPDHRTWCDLFAAMCADYAPFFDDYGKGRRLVRRITEERLAAAHSFETTGGKRPDQRIA